MPIIIYQHLTAGMLVHKVRILHNSLPMMTSSNGNIFRVTGDLCGEFTGEFPAQRPVTRSFDVFFDLRPNKRLSTKQSRGSWFDTLSRPLWRHWNDFQAASSWALSYGILLTTVTDINVWIYRDTCHTTSLIWHLVALVGALTISPNLYATPIMCIRTRKEYQKYMRNRWEIRHVVNHPFDTLRPRQNGRRFADDIFKCIF